MRATIQLDDDVYELARRTWPPGRSSAWARSRPLTQSGFVRVSSNERVLVNAKSPREAMEYFSPAA
jgi:hypothetical protein